MTYLEAAHLILAEARKSLTETEIVQRALRKGLISPRTRLPERSMGVVLKRASQNPNSSFEQAGPHTWQLKASKILEHPMSMREAALKILSLAGKPLHYMEITRRAIRAGLIRPEGKTPAYTLRARVGDDMTRSEDSPFERVGDGTYGLRIWPRDLRKAKRAAKKTRPASKVKAEKVAKVKAEKPAKVAKVKAEKPVKVAKVKAEKPIKVAKVKAEKPIKVAKVKAEKPVKVAKVKAEKPAKIAKLKAEKPVKVKAEKRSRRQSVAESAVSPTVTMKPKARVADPESLARLARLRAR